MPGPALPSPELLALYLPAMLLCLAIPGPDMLLALSRGLGPRRRIGAITSALGTGTGIACHSLLFGLGVSPLLQASTWTFSGLKIAGAGYLIWIGIQAIRDRRLIGFEATSAQSLRSMFITGWLSNLLNPKVAIFVIAFIPQFVDRTAGPLGPQIVALGGLFALATVLAYGALGSAAASAGRLLTSRPCWVNRLNIGAGSMLVVSGIGLLVLRQR